MAKKKKKAAAKSTRVTKKVAKKSPGKNEIRQNTLPGMTQTRNNKLEMVARELLRSRNKLKSAKLAFSEAYAASKAAMTKAKLKVYECKDVNFNLVLSQRDDEIKLKERKADQ